LAFGLLDAPPHFQSLMNSILFDKLYKGYKGVIVYLDDVLVIREKQERKVLTIVKWILEQFKKKKLFCKIQKCEFFVEIVT